MIIGDNHKIKTIILMMIRHFYMCQIFLDEFVIKTIYNSELIKQKILPSRENVTTLLNIVFTESLPKLGLNLYFHFKNRLRKRTSLSKSYFTVNVSSKTFQKH